MPPKKNVIYSFGYLSQRLQLSVNWRMDEEEEEKPRPMLKELKKQHKAGSDIIIITFHNMSGSRTKPSRVEARRELKKGEAYIQIGISSEWNWMEYCSIPGYIACKKEIVVSESTERMLKLSSWSHPVPFHSIPCCAVIIIMTKRKSPRPRRDISFLLAIFTDFNPSEY